MDDNITIDTKTITNVGIGITEPQAKLAIAANEGLLEFKENGDLVLDGDLIANASYIPLMADQIIAIITKQHRIRKHSI